MNQNNLSMIFTAGFALLAASSTAHAACPRGTTLRGEVDGKKLCVFESKKYLNQQIVLTAENSYLIEQGTYFGGDNQANSTLRIEAGTRILANPGTFLVIQRGSQIFAEGTQDKPVVFTSAKLIHRKRGEWGGVVINGNAPINACGAPSATCEAISEGIKEEAVKFGGGNPEDNSGVLRYVRVEFGGYPISPDNELNGITFNAVGSKTEVDYLQVHMNADDGIEFFGGTVNLKHVVLTGNEDDSIDWDMGWTGKVQFLIAEQADDSADNGVEADNLKSPMNAEPRSNPQLSNLTLIGGAKSGHGLLLRRGTGGAIMNSIVSGFSKGCVDVDDAETFRNATSGLRMTHTLLSCSKPFEVEAGDPWSLQDWFQNQVGNRTVDAALSNWVPAPGSPALGAGETPDDLFFDPVDFAGAIGTAEENWTTGWITRSTE